MMKINWKCWKMIGKCWKKIENDEKWLKNDWKWRGNMSVMVKLLEMTSFEQVTYDDESDKHI